MPRMTLYRTLRKEIEEALVNRGRSSIASMVYDLSDDSIHEGERLMVDEIELIIDSAVGKAKERATCSACLARTYRGNEDCLCPGGGDAEDYDEVLEEELHKR